MNKRLAAGALAAVSTASVLGVVGASPASAATPCGTYPPGLQYSLVRAPGSSSVAQGAIVSLRGTLRRGGQACVGFNVGLYTKPFDVKPYRLKGSAQTSTTGSVRPVLIVDKTVRYFFNLNLGGGNNVQSGISQFVVRR